MQDWITASFTYQRWGGQGLWRSTEPNRWDYMVFGNMMKVSKSRL